MAHWLENMAPVSDRPFVDDTAIAKLALEAGQAGDMKMYRICQDALKSGDNDARAECASVIAAAKAMQAETDNWAGECMDAARHAYEDLPDEKQQPWAYPQD